MNIIIGVGGTGAKVVEAVINLAAMGVGPNEMKVGFVDQDESNGNLNRARTVFEAYRRARNSWRGGSAHTIDGTDECPLFKTAIEPLDGDDGLWIPDEKAGATLAGVFGPMNEDKHLFDALFETGGDEESEEQNLDLGQGYRGRPHIGAAAMTLRAEERNPFWDAITEAIKSAGMQGNCRIMLAGSVFGGTGAAGFPTIARIIRDRLREEGITRNVDIGGILMLPYFGFPDPDEDQDQNVARAHEQQVQARGALRHYQHMLGDKGQAEDGEHIFDQLYLIGWNPFFSIDVHSKGSGTQRNPALLPEFLAASAGYRFFETQRLPDEEVTQNITVSARGDYHRIDWDDIPAISGNDEDRKRLHEIVSNFLRFAVAFKFWKPQIDDPSKRKEVRRDQWYKTQQLDRINWDENSPSQALNNFEDALDHAVGWCASIDAYSRRDADNSFELWRVGYPLVEEIDYRRLDLDPHVRPGLNYPEYEQLYTSVATKFDDEKDADMPNVVDLSDNLTQLEVEGDHKNMGRFIAALYEFSDIRPIMASEG
ncbi:tubulin-like doman-containing protein [Aurantiacibacter sediminis]|uniref:Tubulin/FtsZ GTPase domain-containing protein n=1 Tax=Aurantiacibacter sediminis TaxID=2793064 RepID=A0ABS0N6B3_9SPHN|nr:tubulin-like doman-containing protein [Aurantiacibacter sediminis]MBH5323305.1 hypothetical protein [Aurantiacibacter sediminis]